MDSLQTYIAQKRAAVVEAERLLSEAQRGLDLARAELRVAEEILKLSAASEVVARPTVAQLRGQKGATPKGRQPGAISMTWRRILLSLWDEYPSGFDEENAASVVDAHGIEVRRPSELRRRLDHHAEHGYVEHDGSVWRVTAHAAEHFNFDEMRASRSEAHKKNDPPHGGSDAGKVAAFPEMPEQDEQGDLPSVLS